MARVRITPAIIKWAQQRAGVDDEQLARKMGLSERPETFASWLNGSEKPTLHQAQELAKHLRIPFGYLFLSEPPLIRLPVADFRSLPNTDLGNFSPDLQEVIYDAMRKRDWLRERRIEESFNPLAFVGSFSPNSNPIDVAADIRRTLDLPETPGIDASTREDHLRFLVQNTENSGILVLQSGVVENNTRRPLHIQEFRGFVLSDEYAPVIFINNRDWPSARIFTLAHELAHLWIGDSGVSRPELDPARFDAGPDHERASNRIAAELLVPAHLLDRQWSPRGNPYTVAEDLSNTFQVSVFVILIRAYDLQLINYTDLQAAIARARRDLPGEPVRKSAGGGNFYRTLAQRNSRLFVRELSSAVLDGSLQHHEAARLLNINHIQLNQVLQQ